MKGLLRKVWRWLTVADASGSQCGHCSNEASYFLSANKDNWQYCDKHRPPGWFR